MVTDTHTVPFIMTIEVPFTLFTMVTFVSAPSTLISIIIKFESTSNKAGWSPNSS